MVSCGLKLELRFFDETKTCFRKQFYVWPRGHTTGRPTKLNLMMEINKIIINSVGLHRKVSKNIKICSWNNKFRSLFYFKFCSTSFELHNLFWCLFNLVSLHQHRSQNSVWSNKCLCCAAWYFSIWLENHLSRFFVTFFSWINEIWYFCFGFLLMKSVNAEKGNDWIYFMKYFKVRSFFLYRFLIFYSQTFKLKVVLNYESICVIKWTDSYLIMFQDSFAASSFPVGR